MEFTKLEEYLQRFQSSCGEDHECIAKVTTALKNNELQLVTLVEKLGFLLSSPEKENRSLGLSLLVQVLRETGHSILTVREVQSLVTFFCARLSDHHDFLPTTLQGLLLLSDYPGLEANEIQTMVRSIFSEVHTAAQLQEDRRKIYAIFCNLLDQKMTVLQDLGSEFLVGFIQTMDGERDPRCLLMAFKTVSLLALHFTLGEHVEDLFEVVACYFPVDFRAPAADPFGVTREELTEMLTNFMASSPLFAPFALPLFLEKLNSELDSAKLESLATLQRCAKTYGASGLRPHLKDIYASIRREVFSGRDEAVSAASLTCLTSIVSSLAGTESVELTTFLESVWKECSQVIQGDSELSVISASILRAAISGTTSSHRKELLDTALDHMTKVLKESQGAQRLSHLQALSVILDVPAVGSFGSWNGHTECWSLLVSHLSPEENRLTPKTSDLCWTAVAKLLNVGLAVPETEIVPLLQRVLSHLASADNQSLMSAVKALSLSIPGAVTSHLVPRLVDAIPRESGAGDVLATICAVSSQIAENSVLGLLMTRLTGLDVVLYEEALTKCVEAVTLSLEANQNLDHFVEPYLCPLLSRVLTSAYKEPAGMEGRPVFTVLEIILSALSPGAGMQIVQEILQVICQNQASVILKCEAPLPFDSLPPESQSALFILLRCTIPHLKLSTEPCRFQDVVRWMVSRSSLDSNLAQALAGLANKCPCCGQLTFDLIREVEVTDQMIVVLVWLTKALLLSGHPATQAATELLLGYLANPHLGALVAEGFRTILQPSIHVLTARSHARIALFYSQRFFFLTAPTLLQSYQTSKECKSNYLRALCCQLKYLPVSVLKTELPPLLPVLIATLDANGPEQVEDLLLSGLDALGLLLGGQNAQLSSPHLSTLVPRLTHLARNHSSMKVRVGSLRCLRELSHLPTSDVLLYSSDVLYALKPCLDDKKRLVRAEAAKAAAKWHLVGQDTGE